MVFAAMAAGVLALSAASVSTPSKVGVIDAPCAALEPPPAAVAAYKAQMVEAAAAHRAPPAPAAGESDTYGAWQRRLLLTDFFGLCHYQAVNTELPAPTGRRVVFFGDSITELWGAFSPSLFHGDTVNRGVSGQTTAQMLGRFRADVIDLHPRIVHILAGTNDIAGNTGPTSLADIENNLRSMVDLAQAHDIVVVIASILPADRFTWRPELRPVPTIRAYNLWLRDFAQSRHLVFCDYYTALADTGGGMQPSVSDDGVHPNAKGFAIMTPIALRALDSARRGVLR